MHTNHTWTDSDNDQLTLQLHEDGDTLLLVNDSSAARVNAVELTHAQALEVYHKLGDHLMATAETDDQVPTGYGDTVDADDLDAWAENRPELPDATTDGYD